MHLFVRTFLLPISSQLCPIADTPSVDSVLHQQHSYAVMDMAITSDGSRLVSCAWDGKLVSMGELSTSSLVFTSWLSFEVVNLADINTKEFKSVQLMAKLCRMQLLSDRIVVVTDVMSVVSFLDLETMQYLRAYEVTPMGVGNNGTFVINETKLGAGMANGCRGNFAVFDLAADLFSS